jgi:hypothetical protein
MSCPVPPVQSHCPVSPLLSHLSFCIAHLSPQSGPCCHVLASCPISPALADLPRLTCQADLSRLTCLYCPVQCHCRCHVLDVKLQLYCQGCPATVVLSQLSWRLPCPSVMFWPSCPLCLVLPVPSRLSSLAVLSWLSCPGFPVLAVLFQQSSPQLFCPNCPVLVVMFSLSCPIYFILHPLS